jgi:hypothetical protein
MCGVAAILQTARTLKRPVDARAVDEVSRIVTRMAN